MNDYWPRQRATTRARRTIVTMAIGLAALLATGSGPAQAFFCFSFSFGGGPRMGIVWPDYGPPRFFGPTYAPRYQNVWGASPPNYQFMPRPGYVAWPGYIPPPAWRATPPPWQGPPRLPFYGWMP